MEDGNPCNGIPAYRATTTRRQMEEQTNTVDYQQSGVGLRGRTGFPGMPVF